MLLILHSQIRLVDGQLDRLQLTALGPAFPPSADNVAGALSESSTPGVPSPRILELQSIVRALSSTSSSAPQLSSWRIAKLLDQAQLVEAHADSLQEGADRAYEEELEWLLVSKATMQTYGLILDTLCKCEHSVAAWLFGEPPVIWNIDHLSLLLVL